MRQLLWRPEAAINRRSEATLQDEIAKIAAKN
jgi:hypothetical protein